MVLITKFKLSDIGKNYEFLSIIISFIKDNTSTMSLRLLRTYPILI